MILLAVLILMLLFLVIFTVFAISVGGATFIIIFGDVIVCITFIVLLIRHLIKKRS